MVESYSQPGASRPGTGPALRARSDIADDAPDWTTLRLPYADRSATASELASYADDVIVDLPDDLRAAVIANLAGAAAGSARVAAAGAKQKGAMLSGLVRLAPGGGWAVAAGFIKHLF